MLGERGPQRGLFEADTMYLKFVGQNTFYVFLAGHRAEIFRDEDFAKLYCLENGRPSVPPSQLATALVLQTYDRVSDDEAKRRADSTSIRISASTAGRASRSARFRQYTRAATCRTSGSGSSRSTRITSSGRQSTRPRLSWTASHDQNVVGVAPNSWRRCCAWSW